MVYMYHSFLVHSSADGHLGCFHVLAMTNSAAMNIGVHVSLSDMVSLVCMPRSGIAGSYGSMAESAEELKRLLMKVKEKSEKSGLKLNIQRTKMQSSPITPRQTDGKTMKIVTDFTFGSPKVNHCRW